MMVACAQRVFAVEESDVASGLPLSAAAGFCMLCAYYYLQPLSDALALKVGIARTPLITVASMVLIAVANPVYACSVRALPVQRVLPAVYAVLVGALLVFAGCFAIAPGELGLSFAFSVFTGTFSLFLTTTFWARMASLHTKPQAKRVYGVIAAGAQLGQICASATAAWLFSRLGEQVTLWSAVLVCGTVYLVSWRGATHIADAAHKSDAETRGAAGGRGSADAGTLERCFGGVRLLLSTPLLRAISLHTLLTTFLVAGIWYERAAAVAAAFESDTDRYAFFATLNLIVGASTLLIQLLLFSHLLRRGGFALAMVCEPVVVAIGLAISCVRPGLLSIALLDGARKVVHYALLKPAKEGLYAALTPDVQFIAKPLLDTLIYRAGSLLGATYFAAALQWGLRPETRRYMLLVGALAWGVNSWWVGHLAELSQLSQNDAVEAEAMEAAEAEAMAEEDAAGKSSSKSPPPNQRRAKKLKPSRYRTVASDEDSAEGDDDAGVGGGGAPPIQAAGGGTAAIGSLVTSGVASRRYARCAFVTVGATLACALIGLTLLLTAGGLLTAEGGMLPESVTTSIHAARTEVSHWSELARSEAAKWGDVAFRSGRPPPPPSPHYPSPSPPPRPSPSPSHGHASGVAPLVSPQATATSTFANTPPPPRPTSPSPSPQLPPPAPACPPSARSPPSHPAPMPPPPDCSESECTSAGADCCAPHELNELATCSGGLTPVRTGTSCFNFVDGAYTCCPPPPPPPPHPPLVPGAIRLAAPMTMLPHGVSMPSVLLGTGGSTWMNEDRTATMVRQALLAGFRGVDTANHYRVHGGVRRGIAEAKAAGHTGPVWIQTKMEGCGNSFDAQSRIVRGSCYEDTLRVFEASLRELGVESVDSTLLHSPPCVVGAPWVNQCFGPGDVYPDRADCSADEPCEMIQQQWRALEEAYTSGRTRSIGVSNYCSACLDCLARTATISPHINQLNFHLGMGAADPAGLLSDTERRGARVQAYRPLAQGSGVGALLRDPTVAAVARAHHKSAAQVALRWVVQLGHALTTTTENVEHVRLLAPPEPHRRTPTCAK